MSNTIIWVHGDCLRATNPAYLGYPETPSLFVWDDALLREWHISLKRIVFMYECLLEMPCAIRRGDVADELIAFARAHGAQRIATVDSPSPRFRAIVQRLKGDIPVEILPEEPFLAEEAAFDLSRFSRYWRAAERHAFEPTRRA
jgi:hypothetical protein